MDDHHNRKSLSQELNELNRHLRGDRHWTHRILPVYMSKDGKGVDVADKNILNNIGPKHDVNDMEKNHRDCHEFGWEEVNFLHSCLYLDWQFSILDY